MNRRTMHLVRWILADSIVLLGGCLLAGCRARVLSLSGHASEDASVSDAAAIAGLTCGDSGAGLGGPIGTPCTMDIEKDPAFGGFGVSEESLESCSASPSGAPVCLAYHFQGRATCPYGQSAQGLAPAGAHPCETPTGEPVDRAVQAQCVDRPSTSTVFWSCRCANPAGGTDDGNSYCTCPSETRCTQVVPALGSDPTAGAYCIPPAADYDPSQSCTSLCDPTSRPCP
jgi:hypothetical protein